ncbi:phosphate ABC transporter ATP-binding protein [Neobacillus pocheonensis]|uniref:Phosphate ABC transporter ATP-binding protein n=1 Tax=Neobacillus pocheonensis TaxID=363869 RepID=A0ABT0WC96_9BACI|nr:phosphate ABC transporter ATP-binding protein [Neobacillus pocheonensis]
MEKLITIENIVKKDSLGQPILNGISAKVMEGEFITIIGPSGSGKSTFLSLINRMTEPDSGLLRFKGTPYVEMDVLKLRRKIGMVFQLPTMLPGTVRDNLLIGLSPVPGNPEQCRNRRPIRPDCPPKINKRTGCPFPFGGQKQRISLARSLANRPEILLLDEVTASLDPTSTEEIEELIQRLHQNGTTILWVSHNLKQAKKVGEYTWVIAGGKIVEQGHPNEVFVNPKHVITQEFIATSFGKEPVT